MDWLTKHAARIILALTIAFAILWFSNNFSYGAYLDGVARELYASYANDILLPFGFYFGLCALENFIPALRSWKIKAAIAFLVPSIMEILQPLWAQGIGLNFITAEHLGLGISFDPFDFFAYAAGVLFAAFTERKFLNRFAFWN